MCRVFLSRSDIDGKTQIGRARLKEGREDSSLFLRRKRLCWRKPTPLPAALKSVILLLGESMGFGKQGKGQIFYDRTGFVALTTLGNETAILVPSQYVDALVEDVRLIKLVGSISVKGFTTGEGPIIYGIMNGELSITEIAEVFLSEPKNTNDRGQLEASERAVFPLGVSIGDDIVPWGDVQGHAGGSTDAPMTFEKTLRWTFANPNGWTYFAINMSGAALTTGGSVAINGKHFGVFVV